MSKSIRLGGNDNVTVVLENDSWNDRWKEQTKLSQMPDQRMLLLTALLEKHAMVAAAPDGEDSSGRQRLRLSTPAELVARCAELVELSYSTAREKGWLVEIIRPSETDEEKDN